MDAINNLANTASKLVFGEKEETTQSGQEPVSGELGRGTADEPYDAGNKHEDPSMSGQAAQETHSTGETTGGKLSQASQDHGPHSTYAGNILDPRTGPQATSTTFGNVDGANYGSSNTTGASTGDSTTLGGSSSNFGSNDGSTALGSKATGPIEDIPTAPSTTTGPTATEHLPSTSSTTPGLTSNMGQHDGPQDTLGGSTASGTTGGAAQGVNTAGAIRPEHETPGTGVTSIHSNDPKGSDVRPSEANEARPNTNVGGFGVVEPSVSADPSSAQQSTDKQQGGDRPFEEPKGEKAEAVKSTKDEGEAALKKKDPNDHSGEPLKMHDGKEGKTERSESSAGQEGGGEHGKEKGTGEQYVKSSGLAADGGNFDASNPGAGREADRLMESKGVQRTGAADSKEDTSPAPKADHGSSDSPSGGKKSLGEKVKEKLHIGKH
ncbi:hypothetical protein K490DRAFT_65849 [Saccharata proteae CBS 121410]|uniref:Glycine-rich cell wall structural protein 1 n=1 Tax=Saccharata proteae CBS 121410 TaxID=1314787 RepID=A0A9P4HW06_9PEZI|nr:hypothetical protein K490DRAFT_65849 [Saccharata proteae CBS 121410]